MLKRIQYPPLFCIFILLLALLSACASEKDLSQDPIPEQPESAVQAAAPDMPAPVVSVPTESGDATPGDDFSSDSTSGWPVYTLDAELPDAPDQMLLYIQTVPAGLPDDERLAALMTQLKLTGEISGGTGEGGEEFIKISGNSGWQMFVSDDPLNMVLFLSSSEFGNETDAAIFSPEERARKAEAFLNERGLLDFPHFMEPPQLSRERDRAIRVVPLIDGYALHDYDALNGRLLLWFDSAGEVSAVFWRPLKLAEGELVEILTAREAWDGFVRGDFPQGNETGQYWQVQTIDYDEPYAVASMDYGKWLSSWGRPDSPYDAVTINKVELVYFANDLSLGMSPFATPADSPAQIVFPIWQLSGYTANGRELVALWPAIRQP